MSNAFNNGFLTWLAISFFAARIANVGVRRFHQLETGDGIVQARIVVPQTLNVVMRCFQVLVGNQNQVNLQARFDFGDVGALFVQQERGNIDRYLCMQGGDDRFSASRCSEGK